MRLKRELSVGGSISILPIIIMLLYFPLNFLYLKYCKSETIVEYLRLTTAQNLLFLIISTLVWPFLFLNEQIEGRGNEILLRYKHRNYKKILFSIVVNEFLLLPYYCVMLCVTNEKRDYILRDWIRNAVIVVLITSMFYFGVIIIKNIIYALIAISIYTIMSIMGTLSFPFLKKFMLINEYLVEKKDIVDNIIPKLVIAIILLVAAVVANKKYKKCN